MYCHCYELLMNLSITTGFQKNKTNFWLGIFIADYILTGKNEKIYEKLLKKLLFDSIQII